MRRGPNLWKFAGVVAVGLFAILFFLLISSKRTASRLANGTELSLLAMTHGPSNIFVAGTLLERLVYKFGLTNGISFRSFKIAPPSPMLEYWHKANGTASFPNRVVVWLGHRGPTNAPALPVPEQKWHSDIRATLADESGEEWETRTGVAHARRSVGHGLNWISSWDFPSFPRRGKSLRFRMYARKGSNDWETLADFKLPNPDRGPHPTWTPSVLPVTVKSNDLEVSLVKLVSGVKPMPHNYGVRPFTTATFAVKENGRPTDAWIPDQMEMTDATGNEPWVPMVNNNGSSNRLVNYEIQCVSLSPSETWRLRTRFARAKDTTAKPWWTSPELVVSDGAVEPMSLTTNINSHTITVECNQSPFRNTIHLTVGPLTKNARVGHGKIVDDQGRLAVYESGFFSDTGFDAQWKIPAGAKWLKVSTGLTELRNFEFLARPTAVPGNSP